MFTTVLIECVLMEGKEAEVVKMADCLVIKVQLGTW